jgi:hypothetical protein
VDLEGAAGGTEAKRVAVAHAFVIGEAGQSEPLWLGREVFVELGGRELAVVPAEDEGAVRWDRVECFLGLAAIRAGVFRREAVAADRDELSG